MPPELRWMRVQMHGEEDSDEDDEAPEVRPRAPRNEGSPQSVRPLPT